MTEIFISVLTTDGYLQDVWILRSYQVFLYISFLMRNELKQKSNINLHKYVSDKKITAQ